MVPLAVCGSASQQRLNKQRQTRLTAAGGEIAGLWWCSLQTSCSRSSMWADICRCSACSKDSIKPGTGAGLASGRTSPALPRATGLSRSLHHIERIHVINLRRVQVDTVLISRLSACVCVTSTTARSVSATAARIAATSSSSSTLVRLYSLFTCFYITIARKLSASLRFSKHSAASSKGR